MCFAEAEVWPWPWPWTRPWPLAMAMAMAMATGSELLRAPPTTASYSNMKRVSQGLVLLSDWAIDSIRVVIRGVVSGDPGTGFLSGHSRICMHPGIRE